MLQNTSPAGNISVIEQSKLNFRRRAKRLFLNPVFIALFLVGICFLTMASLSLVFQHKNLFLPVGVMVGDATNTWGRLALINVFVAIGTGFFVLTGFLVVFISVLANSFNKGCKVGFYLIKLPKFIQNILTMVTALLAGIRIIGAICGMWPDYVNLEDPATINFALTVIIGCIAVAAIAILVILFSFKSLTTLSVMKEAITTTTPISDQFSFTALGCFAVAIIALVGQLIFGFNVTIILGSVCAVLFGVFCLQFRTAMKRLEPQD